MTIYTAFDSGTPTTTGTTWTTTTNASGTNNSTFAVLTNAVSASSSTITLPDFGTAGISGIASDTISAVGATVWQNVATTSRWTSVTATLLDSAGSAIGSGVTLTLSTTTTNSQTITFTTTPTAAQVAAGLQIKLTAVKSGSVSSTFNVDAVQISVTYSAPLALPYVEPWTGTTGAAWPGVWTVASSGSGTGTIQSNKGRLTTPAGTAFSGTAGTLSSLTTAMGDGEVVVTFTTVSTAVTQFVAVVLNGDGTISGGNAGFPTNGYALQIAFNATAASSTLELDRIVAGTDTTLTTSATRTLTGGTAYRVRFQHIGAVLKWRVWTAASAEPTAWDGTWTDSSPYNGTGKPMLFMQTNDTTARSVDFDDLTVFVPNPQFVSATTAAIDISTTATSGSVVVNAPLPIAAGNLLVAIMGDSSGINASEVDTAITPSGWTLQTQFDNTNDGHIFLWTKTATSSEPSTYTFGINKAVLSTYDLTVTVLQYMGMQYDQVAHNSSAGTTTNSPTAPTITTTADNGVYIAGWVQRIGNGLITPPTTMVSWGQQSSGGLYQMDVADVPYTTRGASGTFVASSAGSADRYQALTVSLIPSTVMQASFDGQANATNFTAANSSAFGDSAAGVVTLTSSQTATYSTTQGSAQIPGAAALALAVTTGQAYVDYAYEPRTPNTRTAFRFWVWMPSGVNLDRFIGFRSGVIGLSSISLSYVGLNSSGNLVFNSAASGTDLITSTSAFPTNQWVLVQGAQTIGTTTGNGSVELGYWLASDTVNAVWSSSASSINLGTTGPTDFRIGTNVNATVTHTKYIDDLYVTDELAPGSFPGPATLFLAGVGTLSASAVVGGSNFSGTAALSGVGVLSTVGGPAASAGLSGVGVLSVIALPNLTAGAALSGAGSLSAQVLAALATVATLSGVGALTTVGGPSALAALSGVGSLSTVRTPALAATAALSGAGSLSAAIVPALATTATLAGSGSLTAALSPALATTAGLSGVGVLSVVAKPILATTAGLSGSGVLSATVLPALTLAVGLSGVGALSVVATPAFAATAALSGVGVLSDVATPAFGVTAALSGVGTLTTVSLNTAVMTGSGALSVVVKPVLTALAALSGVGVLSTTNVPAVVATTALSGTGALSISATPVLAAVATLTGTGSLSAAVVPAITGQTASLSGAGSLSAILVPKLSALAALGGTGTLSSGSSFNAAAGLSGAGSLGVTQVPALAVLVALAGSGALSAASVPGGVAAPGLSGTGSLSTATHPNLAAVAALAGTGALSAVPIIHTIVAAMLSGLGVLDAGIPVVGGGVLRDIYVIVATLRGSPGSVSLLGGSALTASLRGTAALLGSNHVITLLNPLPGPGTTI